MYYGNKLKSYLQWMINLQQQLNSAVACKSLSIVSVKSLSKQIKYTTNVTHCHNPLFYPGSFSQSRTGSSHLHIQSIQLFLVVVKRSLGVYTNINIPTLACKINMVGFRIFSDFSILLIIQVLIKSTVLCHMVLNNYIRRIQNRFCFKRLKIFCILYEIILNIYVIMFATNVYQVQANSNLHEVLTIYRRPIKGPT